MGTGLRLKCAACEADCTSDYIQVTRRPAGNVVGVYCLTCYSKGLK